VAAAAMAVGTAVAVEMTGIRRVAPAEGARLGPRGAGAHRVPGAAAEPPAAAQGPGEPERGASTGGAGRETIGTARPPRGARRARAWAANRSRGARPSGNCWWPTGGRCGRC
jgi:hypothetical protein